jgi:tRNA dimethylallyltransferase
VVKPLDPFSPCDISRTPRGYAAVRTGLVLAVLGPTATGKSALALALARHYGGEIVNCDSTAVYRGFDIGTDKVPGSAQRGIPHHLIDIANPTDDYTAAQYARDAAAAIRSIHERGHVPILTGGTGFYFRAIRRRPCAFNRAI